jgi:hypothetical protein
VICQRDRDATTAPLTQRLDAIGKGVWLARIPLICSNAAFNLPVRETVGQVTGALGLGESQSAYAIEFRTSLAPNEGSFGEGLTCLAMGIAIP